jgi:hypothetical protein
METNERTKNSTPTFVWWLAAGADMHHPVMEALLQGGLVPGYGVIRGCLEKNGPSGEDRFISQRNLIFRRSRTGNVIPLIGEVIGVEHQTFSKLYRITLNQAWELGHVLWCHSSVTPSTPPDILLSQLYQPPWLLGFRFEILGKRGEELVVGFTGEAGRAIQQNTPDETTVRLMALSLYRTFSLLPAQIALYLRKHPEIHCRWSQEQITNFLT